MGNVARAGLPLMILVCTLSCSGKPTRPEVDPLSPSRVMYARCNLRVLKGYYINWVNWQAAPEVLPLGTELRVTEGPREWTLQDPLTGDTYLLDTGAKGEEPLLKFLSQDPIAPSVFSVMDQEGITDRVARVGMSREGVYAAMGPPKAADGAGTSRMTREQILKADLWVYARKRAHKSTGVEFAPGGGPVVRTEHMPTSYP